MQTGTVTGATTEGTTMSDVERIDKYMIRVDGVTVRATPDQEARLRMMTPEQRQRFVKIMGGTA